MVIPVKADHLNNRVIRAPHFSAIETTTMPERVRRELASAIADGRLRPGQELPRQDELAREFGVSRSVVREALKLLEASGLILARPARRATVALDPATAVSVGWSTWLAAHRDEVLETLALRKAIECLVAGKAAGEADAAAVRRLSEHVGGLDLASRDRAPAATAAAHDVAFHHDVAAASGSDLMLRLIDELAEVVHQSRLAAFSISGRALESAREHRLVLDAIARADATGAEAAMAAHLDGVINSIASMDSTSSLDSRPAARIT